VKVRVKVPPSPFRLLKERYFGEDVRDPRVARAALARLSARLPADVAPIVAEAVTALIDYQDPDYALLYLDRIERYVGPAGITLPALAELARLMAARMQFEDPIRIAQLTLAAAGGVDAKPDPASRDRIETFRWDDIIRMLPRQAAERALNAFRRLRLGRLLGRSLKLRFSAAGRLTLLRLNGLAALRITRPFSERFRMERTWVERWLHMVDRSLVKQPGAAADIVRSAELIAGHGDAYHQGLAEWSVIIDGVVKPACDGTLVISDLGSAIRKVRHAADGEAGPRRLRAMMDAQARLYAGAVRGGIAGEGG
jgi:hypothetical protein